MRPYLGLGKLAWVKAIHGVEGIGMGQGHTCGWGELVWVKVIHEGRGSWYGSRPYVGVGMGGCQSPNNVCLSYFLNH